MSGYVDSKTQELARLAGFDRFQPKPSDIREVIDIVGPLCKVADHGAGVVR